VAAPSGRVVRVVVSIDPLYGNLEFGRWYTTVTVDGRRAVSARTPYERRAAAVLGAGVERVPASTTACRAVAERAGLLSGPPAAG
jgi:hypothetical protein